MADYITLLGAEKIEHAAREMRSAADRMAQSADGLDFWLTQFQQFLDEWLVRFEDVMRRATEGK